MTEKQSLKTRRISLKTYLITIALITVIFSSALVVVYANGAFPPDIYLDDLPSTASYVIKTDGVNVWAVRGDGKIQFSGTDASTVGNAAINALPNGGIVLFSAGNYSGIVLSIQKSNIIIEGEGVATNFITTVATANCIMVGDPTYITPYENVQIRNLQITSNVVKTAGSGIEFRAIQDTASLRPSLSGVFNVLIEKQWDGLVLRGVTGVYVSQVIVLYSENRGIACVDIHNSNIHLSNVMVDGDDQEGGSESATCGIQLSQLFEGFLTNVHVVRSSVGLYITGTIGQTSGSILVQGSSFSDNKDMGVYILQGNDAYLVGVSFDNCQFATNGILYAPHTNARGATVQSSSTGTVEGVYFNRCTFFQNGGHGLFIAGTILDVQTTSSTFASNGGTLTNTYSGAYVEVDVTHFGFVGNQFLSGTRGSYDTQAYGIYITSGTSNWYMITDNTFIGNNVGAYYDGGSGANKTITNNLS